MSGADRYISDRARLADRIAQICAETLKRKWQAPDYAGHLWLADAVLAVRARVLPQDFDANIDRAMSAGYGFIDALLKAGRTEEAERVAHMLVGLRGHRDRLLYLAEQIKVALAWTNDGSFPCSTEKNGPLVKLTAALFNLAMAKIEPGEISLSTVADVLSGRRHKGAI